MKMIFNRIISGVLAGIVCLSAVKLPALNNEFINESVITANAADYPAMSSEEAELFVGFITNNGKLSQKKIHDTEMYKVLAGEYKGNDLKEVIIELTSAIRYSATFQSNKAEHHKQYLSNELITYLSNNVKEEDRDDALAGDLIDDVLEGDTYLAKRNAKAIMTKGICENIDTYFKSSVSAYDIWSSYSTVKSQWNDVYSFYEKVANAYKGAALVFENEYAGRYGYFSFCLYNYDTAASEEIANMLNVDQDIAFADQNVFSYALNCFSWLTGKESFQNHTKTIDEWARKIHRLEKYAETLDYCDDYWNNDFADSMLADLPMPTSETATQTTKTTNPNTQPTTKDPEDEDIKYYQSGWDYGKLHYIEIDSNTCMVAGFSNEVNGKKEKGVYIPMVAHRFELGKSISLRVVSIGSCAFSKYPNITSVKLPSSFKSVPEYAFYGCEGLTSVSIPYTVTSVGTGAFSGCKSLTSLGFLPESISSVSAYAFSGCTGLRSAELPSNVTTLEEGVFSGCTSLTSYNIPYKMKTIKSSAFSGSGLVSIDIPSTIESVGDYVFMECKSLTNVSIKTPNIGVNILCRCPKLKNLILFNTENTHSLLTTSNWGDPGEDYYAASRTDSKGYFYIPKKLESITILYDDKVKQDAFRGMSGLKEVVLPDTITEIGSEAFADCTGLTSLDFVPKSVKSIGNNAFAKCTGLTEIEIPEGVESVGSRCFSGCTDAMNLSIPKTLATIGDSAFNGCKCLEKVYVPSTVTHLGEYVFMECTALTEARIETVNDDSSGHYMGKIIFGRCPNLTKLTIANTEQTHTLFLNSNWGDPGEDYYAASRTDSKVYFYIPKKLESITILYDDKVKQDTFRGMSSLKEVVLPDTITEIGSEAFADCTVLTSLDFVPKSVKSIGNNAFAGCTGLTAITLPENVESIGYNCFGGCENAIDLLIYNADCIIYDSDITIPDKAVIHGWYNSTAKEYADKYEREFIPFDSTVTTESTTATEPTTTETIESTEAITGSAEYALSDAELCEWAVNDYCSKHHIEKVIASITSVSDGEYQITITDKNGNILDVYTIDPDTGKGKDKKNKPVDLPQTGNNSMTNLLLVFAAFMLIGIGIIALRSSGFVRRRNEEQ